MSFTHYTVEAVSSGEAVGGYMALDGSDIQSVFNCMVKIAATALWDLNHQGDLGGIRIVPLDQTIDSSCQIPTNTSKVHGII